MAHEFEHERRVEFAETDMAGIVHFANFFRYMEATEHAFVRSLGLVVHAQNEERMVGWARVHAECDYKRPLLYPQPFVVRLLVSDKTESSLSYRFLFRTAEREVARGALRVVCVTRGPGDAPLRAAPMPSDLDAAISVAPREVLEALER